MQGSTGGEHPYFSVVRFGLFGNFCIFRRAAGPDALVRPMIISFAGPDKPKAKPIQTQNKTTDFVIFHRLEVWEFGFVPEIRKIWVDRAPLWRSGGGVPDTGSPN